MRRNRESARRIRARFRSRPVIAFAPQWHLRIAFRMRRAAGFMLVSEASVRFGLTYEWRNVLEAVDLSVVRYTIRIFQNK